MINIGLVGCGRISEKHLEAISQLKDCKLIAVCDVIKDRAKNVVEKFSCEYYTNYEDKGPDDGEAWFKISKDKQRAGGFLFKNFTIRFYQNEDQTETHWEIT